MEEKKCALLATLIEKLGGSAKVSENEKCDSSEFQDIQQEAGSETAENYNY